MSQQTCQFLNLPLELRINIYSYALVEHQPEIPCVVKVSTVVLHRREHGLAYTRRPTAFLVEDEPSDSDGTVLVCPLALSQANRQIRTEFSDYLRTAPVDIVSRIRNFEWSPVTHLISSFPKWRKKQFLVGQDGIAESILYFELGGPYNPDWRTNLMCWIDFVEDWAQDPRDELKTSHETIQDLSTSDRWCRAPPGEIVCDVYTMYQCQRRGIGRLELDKIFFTLLGRYKAEVMLRGGLSRWMSDVFLMQGRGILWS